MTDQVLAAVSALFHGDDPAVKAQADRWLEHWQQTSEAWSVADAILHNPSSSMEAQHFCAQTLKTKASSIGGGMAGSPRRRDICRRTLCNACAACTGGGPCHPRLHASNVLSL
jgi:hypothetical protein